MNARERRFCTEVWEYYVRHGRRSLPWRTTKNPYRILVSEIMLQQTQVERVVPKYRSFLKQFPTVHALAEAPLGEVLRTWQGLGYNRRAKMLHQCAQKVVSEYRGIFPKTHAELVKLPGVGHYTAGAVMAFAFGTAVPIIETNIRSVYIHHFFKDDVAVADREILKIVERTLDHSNVREWYYALMDYGVHVKKEFGNPNTRSKHHAVQSTFKNSDRQIRGAIIRFLTQQRATRLKLHAALPFDMQRIDEQLEKLEREGLIQKTRKLFSLPQ
jgi:A/G-specific adenine glycosylase